jgi:phytanoyl-CoA hydroxylase
MDRGYCLVEGLFSRCEMESIRNDMNSIFAVFSGGKKVDDKFLMDLFKNDFDAFVGCANLCQKLPCVYRLAGSEKIRQVLRGFDLGLPTLNTKPLVSFSSKHTAKSEAYWKVAGHQDYPSNLGSMNGVTLWMPLQDMDSNIGPLEIVPDSDKLGILPHHGIPPVLIEDNFEYISVPMRLGDALFFDTKTIHRSGNNKTEDKIRWSMHFRFNDALEPSFIERKYPKNRTND